MAVIDGPLVTVVIPTWNRSRLVAEAIASVIAQTYRNWELIVVDDGSTDDTLQRLQSFAVPRLRIVRSAHLGHIGRLRNLGARAGDGEFVAFLDSDDLWCPAKLERQISALLGSDAGWSYTEYALMSEAGARLPLRSGKAPAISGRILRALLRKETGVCPCTLIVRRPLFDAIGGFGEDGRIPYRDDMDIALRLARRSEVLALPEVLALIREHPGRMTRHMLAPYEHSAAVYELFLRGETDSDLCSLARQRWAECLANAGADRLEAGEYKTSAILFWSAFTKAGVTVGSLRAAARGMRNRLRRSRSTGIAPAAQRP